MKNEERKSKIQIEHARCVWGLLCSLSSIDQERNNISLFNVIEQFNLPQSFFIRQEREKEILPFPIPHEIVLCWRRTLDISISDEEILMDSKIKTIDSTGKILQEALIPLKFPNGIKRLYSRYLMQGITASVVGDYIHQIELKLSNQENFKKVLEIPFEVRSQ